MGDPGAYDQDAELRKALVQAGLYPEQLQQLERQVNLGQQWMHTPMAQGGHVGNTYVAASPLEHLSNALRQIVGAKMASDAMQRERDMVQRQGQAREKLMGAMQTAQAGYPSPGDGDVQPDPARSQRLLMMAAGSGDPAAQRLSQFALQKMNYERQLEMMRSMVNYRAGSLDIRQQGVDQREREQSPVQDMWGVPVMTPKHSPKGGQGATSVLPGATGAASGGIPSAVLDAGVGVGNGTTPGQAANPLPNSVALQEPNQGQLAALDGGPPKMQMPTTVLDGRLLKDRTTPLNTWNADKQPEQEPPEKPPMVPGLDDAIINDFTREWVTTAKLPDAIHQLPMQARGKVLKAMSKVKTDDYPNADFAPNRNKYAAGVAATKTLENTLRSVSAFEETAKRNAEVAEQAIKKIENTGIPLLNEPIRRIFDRFGMDPDIAGARVGLTTALTEYSKIVSGGTLGQRLTDSQRHELTEGAKIGSITLGQWRSIRAIVDQDAANRKLGLQNQLKEVGASMADVWGANPAAAPSPGGGSPDAGGHEELLNKYPAKK